MAAEGWAPGSPSSWSGRFLGTLAPSPTPPEVQPPRHPVNRQWDHVPSRWRARAAYESLTLGKWDSERQEVLLKVAEVQR